MSEQITPPQVVEDFKAQMVCPRCGSSRAPEGKVIVLVSQRAPGTWLLVGKCVEHKDSVCFWAMLQVGPDQGFSQPVHERTGEDIPLPDAFKGLLA